VAGEASAGIVAAARAYAQAVHHLADLTRAGAPTEAATQDLIGASLRYRVALQESLANRRGRREALDAASTSLGQMRIVLRCAHIVYNRKARTEKNLERSVNCLRLAGQAILSSPPPGAQGPRAAERRRMCML
jgi:hypothetical protein